MKKEIKRNMNEKGITLVALVVTVIILLILAGVTLNIALSENGLFNRAKETSKRYTDASKNESEILENLDGLLEGINVDRTGIKIGDKVNYTPQTLKTSYELKGELCGYGTYTESLPYTLTEPKQQLIMQEKYEWKVLSINKTNGEVEIVGIPTSSNKQDVYFQGALGYNNGVYLLNDLCNALYSNDQLNLKARSINIEDIELGMNNIDEVKKEYKDIPYGTIKLYKNNYGYYPKLYDFQKESGVGVESEKLLKISGIEESNDGTKNGIPMLYSSTEEGYYIADNLTVKSTYYYISREKNYYNEQNFYSTLFETDSAYWVASRFSFCQDSDAKFGIRIVDKISRRTYSFWFRW